MKRLIIVFFAAFLFAMPKPAYADVENGMLSDETEVIVDTDASEDNSSDNDSSDASNDTASDHDSSDASEGDVTHVSQSLVDNTDQNQSAVVVPDDAVDALDGGDLIDSGDPADPTDPSVGTTTEDEGPDDSSGWLTIDGYTYYVDPDTGKPLSGGIFEIDGESYYLRPAGSPYGPEGSLGSGWVTNYGGNTYFFDRESGQMYSDGIFDIDGARYYFRPEESPYGPAGSMGRGWVIGYGDEGLDYFFDRVSATMVIGRNDVDGSSYFFDPVTGAKQTGWFEFDGYRYRYDEDGKMLYDGIYEVEDESYYFRPSGSSYGPKGSVGYGWVWNYGGDTFFFDRNDGHMLSDGIFEVDGSSYYFRPSDSPYGPEGSMGRGWVHGYGEDGVDRFFDRSTGRMLISGTYIIDRAVYRADIEGNLTLSPFGQHLDAASAKQLKVVSAAWNEPTTPLGWCALWVHNVFESYGIVDVYGNANDLYNEYCTSSNPADLQAGMIVAVSRHPGNSGGRVYGHIGIYVGDGIVLDSSGSVRVWNVEDWINSYNGWVTPKWGWYGGRSLR